jgi:hypothetical protein
MSRKRGKKRKRSSRAAPPPPLKEWWEEDWAIPVLGLFAVGLFIVVRDMRAEGLARQAQQAQKAQKGAIRG